MLNRIIAASLQNRLLVLFAALIVLVSGWIVVRNMDIDVFPDLTAPTVTVLTEAHGMEAEEVEKLVTYQVETGLNGSPGVRRIRSSSAAGISIVWVEFDWGTDIYRARQIVSEKLPAVQERLPEGIGEPALAPISSIMGEIMLVGVTSDTLSPMQLRTLADWEVLPRLKAIAGVANVIVIGGEFKQYQVLADPARLKHFDVSLEELTRAVQQTNVNATGGFYQEFGNRYVIKGEGRTRSLAEIGSGLVKMHNGQPVKIADVASVQIGGADKIGDGSLNGRPSVIMTISKQPATNTINLSEEIDRTLTELKTSLPEGVELNTEIFRQSDFIEASVDNLQQTILEGAFFVIVILFLFLANWRPTVISLLSIPLSLLVSFIVLSLLGYTINTMSLGGMAIAIGVLVDDAIIDVENVFRRLRENILRPVAERKPIWKVVYDASLEVRSSIIIATFIIIVSFVPLFFLSGMEGRLLKPLGIAFITSVLTSLIVAITVTPVLCSYLLSKEKFLLKYSGGSRTENWLKQRYRRILEAVLKFPRAVIGITVALFIVSLGLFLTLGRSFLPEFNEGSLVISVVGPPGMSLEESNKTGTQVERILLDFPEISVVTRRTGRAELDEHAQDVNASEVDAPFVLKERDKEAFMAAVREALSMVPGVNITIGAPIAHRIDHMLSGTRANIAIKLFGTDLEKLFTLGKNVQATIQDIPGLVDVSVEQQIEVPQVRISPHRELLAAYGLTVDDFAQFIDVAFAGEAVSQVYEDQRSFDLVVRYDTAARGSMERMRAALVDLPDGRKVPLEMIAEVSSVSSPHTINREDVQRKVVVSANVSGRDLRGAVEAIQQQVAATVRLPEGYRIDYGGQFESEARASEMLLISAIFAVLIIFVLLFYEFGDLKLAGIVLINLPLALIGGILAVYFTTGIISIASLIGFISLFGIATRNGILLVSHYQLLEREQHEEGKDLIIHGSLDRLNPILMTALTAALALIPLAIKADEPGNEIQSPMAVVILGGLLTATFLNLLVIPCVYRIFYRRKELNK